MAVRRNSRQRQQSGQQGPYNSGPDMGQVANQAAHALTEFHRGLSVAARDLRDFSTASRGAQAGVAAVKTLGQALFNVAGATGPLPTAAEIGKHYQKAALQAGSSNFSAALQGAVIGGAFGLTGRAILGGAAVAGQAVLQGMSDTLSGRTYSFGDSVVNSVLNLSMKVPFFGAPLAEVVNPLRRTEARMAGDVGQLMAYGANFTQRDIEFLGALIAPQEARREQGEILVQKWAHSRQTIDYFMREAKQGGGGGPVGVILRGFVDTQQGPPAWRDAAEGYR